jgi:hypothetical protein
MLYTRRPVVVAAVQFDPTVKPWPTGIKPWDKEETRPRDMSWGYMMVNGSRVHVHSGDWLVTHGGRRWLVECDAFDALYATVPPFEEIATVTGEMPGAFAALGASIAAGIQAGVVSRELLQVEQEARTAEDAAASWEFRMKAEGWQESEDGLWSNGVTTLFPLVVERMKSNNITPDELYDLMPNVQHGGIRAALYSPTIPNQEKEDVT